MALQFANANCRLIMIVDFTLIFMPTSYIEPGLGSGLVIANQGSNEAFLLGLRWDLAKINPLVAL